ncbi:serine/threonine-protein kinase [Nannocystis pusilla]|uniref:serine/threonine-protein kinase n=1 Tax=Nannocystis pusilla TaxID=889268 RepID=UPI003B7D1323
MSSVPTQIGPYKVKGLVGKGAMGEVYEGVDAGLGRRVAIKILGKKHRESEEFKTRFLREGKALAQMNHPNVVAVYFIGEHEDRPFLAMEFLDGEDIGAMLKKRGALHPGDAAEVIRQAAIGLAETQRVGVVHRDVKPSNLVVTSTGIVKVTDFGLAKALQEDLSITATGVFVGTPDYLAPEQAMGKEVDARADVSCARLLAVSHVQRSPAVPQGRPGRPLHRGGAPSPAFGAARAQVRDQGLRRGAVRPVPAHDEPPTRRAPVVRGAQGRPHRDLEAPRRAGAPRHADVELRSPEEISEKIRQEQKKTPPGAAPGSPPSGATRTTMIAVGIGVTIGIALGVVLAVMSL